jgi:hypothetical protein
MKLMKVKFMVKKQEIRAGVMSGYRGKGLWLPEFNDGEPDDDGEVVDED